MEVVVVPREPGGLVGGEVKLVRDGFSPPVHGDAVVLDAGIDPQAVEVEVLVVAAPVSVPGQGPSEPVGGEAVEHLWREGGGRERGFFLVGGDKGEKATS